MAKKDINHISELDRFLSELEQLHPEKSASQQAEITKHERIAKLRDDKEAGKKDSAIWQDF